MSETDYRAVSNRPFQIAKTLFYGPEKAVREWVERNFPRPHVEPPGHPTDVPVPDVKLVAPDGSEETYHADNGWTPVSAKPEGSTLA